jgi:hypothetical protein
VPRDREIVDAPFPVLADCVSRGHAGHYIMATRNSGRPFADDSSQSVDR